MQSGFQSGLIQAIILKFIDDTQKALNKEETAMSVFID